MWRLYCFDRSGTEVISVSVSLKCHFFIFDCASCNFLFVFLNINSKVQESPYFIVWIAGALLNCSLWKK